MMKAVQEMQSGLQKIFRAKAKNTELIKKSPEKGLEDYIRVRQGIFTPEVLYILRKAVKLPW